MPEEQHSVMKPLVNPLDQSVYLKASRYAVRVLDEMSRRSQLLKQEGEVAKFDRDEIIPYLGERLGKGGFNNVYELEKINLITENDPTQIQRNHLALTKPKLAVKFLSDEALASPEEFCNGAADLLMEGMSVTSRFDLSLNVFLSISHGFSVFFLVVLITLLRPLPSFE
jgi:hypothetical protein